MKKTFFAFIMIITLFQWTMVRAEGVGNVTCVVNAPDDFFDTIVVKITSVSTPGYNETIEKEAELSSNMFYLGGFFVGIPAGTYSAEAYMYKNGDPDKKPYKNPRFNISAVSSFQILVDQVYEYKIDVVSVSPPTRDPYSGAGGWDETPEEPSNETTPEPELSPEPGSNAIVDLFVDIFKNSWITVILFLIAGGIYAFIWVRKTIYKE